jgi:hypothetical protein
MSLVGNSIRSPERLLDLVGVSHLIAGTVEFFVNLGVEFDDARCSGLDLVGVNLPVPFLGFLVILLCRTDSGHCAIRVLSSKDSRLHLERRLG